MCGISMICTSTCNMDLRMYINKMVEIQKHRGPDSQGSYVDGNVALGHDRLSIQDLSDAGKQPMLSRDGRYVIVFNGEIYNYKLLREELIRKGYSFSSGTDTEVILNLYVEYGDDCLTYLNGAFAFLIYDSQEKTVFGARDRIGEKPFVYAEWNGGVACASEIPAIKIIPQVNLTYSATAIGLYMLRNMRHIPEPFTIYDGIKKLLPGHAIRVRNGKVEKIWKYWRPDWDEKEISVTDVREMLDESVRSRIVADVPVGAMLSGGVDSSAIVYGMVRNEGLEVNTYALGLNKDDEELVRARYMAQKLGTFHKEYYFEPGLQYDYFLKILRTYGEPIMLLPLLHAYEICEHIHEDGMKVVLTGNGADELFYGYNGDNNLALLTGMMNAVPASILTSILNVMNRIRRSKNIENAIEVINEKPGRRKAALYCCSGTIDLTASLFKEADLHKEIIATLTKCFEELFVPYEVKNYIDEANVIGLLIENAHSVTISADLSSMTAGIESRAPFLNHEMVEMAWHINYKEKIPSIRDKSKNKWILKQALRGRLDDTVLYAKKQGFGYNIDENDVLRGSWKPEVDRTFSEADCLKDYLNVDYIWKLKNQFDSNDKTVTAMTIAKLFALLKFVQLAG